MSKSGHEPFDGLAALYAAGALNKREQVIFRAHLEVCRGCVQEVKSLLQVTQGLLQAAIQVVPATSLRNRLLNSTTRTIPHAKAPAYRKSKIKTGQQTAAGPPRQRPQPTIWIATLFVIVTAGIAAWYIPKLDHQISSLQRQLAELQSDLDSSTRLTQILELEIAAADLETDELRAVLSLLTTPNVQQLALTGQPRAPRASAVVFWTDSGDSTLLASGLPPLPIGDLYQLWLGGLDGPISAGLMAPDEDGYAAISVTVPDSVTMPVAMAITVEPASGVTMPTGDIYLLGQPTP